MVIKETPIFTKQAEKLLDAESYRLLQVRLVHDPKAGVLIQGTGGLRKIRWTWLGTWEERRRPRDLLLGNEPG